LRFARSALFNNDLVPFPFNGGIQQQPKCFQRLRFV
jgi:hypothetical protein